MINVVMPRDNDAETADKEDDGFKNRDWYPSSEGGVKERFDKGEYNCITILLFCEKDISTTAFHHFTM